MANSQGIYIYIYTLQGINISPWYGIFEDDFPFPKVGYVKLPGSKFLHLKSPNGRRPVPSAFPTGPRLERSGAKKGRSSQGLGLVRGGTMHRLDHLEVSKSIYIPRKLTWFTWKSTPGFQEIPMKNHQSLFFMVNEGTLLGINISHLGEKENHLQNAIFGGYLSSLEGGHRGKNRPYISWMSLR